MISWILEKFGHPVPDLVPDRSKPVPDQFHGIQEQCPFTAMLPRRQNRSVRPVQNHLIQFKSYMKWLSWFQALRSRRAEKTFYESGRSRRPDHRGTIQTRLSTHSHITVPLVSVPVVFWCYLFVVINQGIKARENRVDLWVLNVWRSRFMCQWKCKLHRKLRPSETANMPTAFHTAIDPQWHISRFHSIIDMAWSLRTVTSHHVDGKRLCRRPAECKGPVKANFAFTCRCIDPKECRLLCNDASNGVQQTWLIGPEEKLEAIFLQICFNQQRRACFVCPSLDHIVMSHVTQVGSSCEIQDVPALPFLHAWALNHQIPQQFKI